MEMTAQNAIYLDAETGGKGRQFKCRFLVPGLVKYDYGVCLLTKENADRFIKGFVGCPVIINHHEVTDKNAKELSVGNIFSVWFDDKDGYYWCNGIINDKKAIELIEKGYSVSCQYTITEYADNNSGALHNGNPYDKIIENGKPEHLAIVNNPRYEGAIIAVNAILAQNEDKWITIHPNGEESKGKHLLIKDGESVEDAMHRNGWYKKRQAKDEKSSDENIKSKIQKSIEQSKKTAKNPKFYDGFDVVVKDGIVKVEKDGKLSKTGFKYDDGATDDIGEDWNTGALGNLIQKWNTENPKQSDKEEKGDEPKELDNYEKFHKSYYNDNKTAWSFKKEKGGTYSVTRYDEKGNYVTANKSKKFDELDKYIEQFDNIKLDIPKRKIKGKDEFQEDKKTIEDFKNKGFEIINQYDDGYNVKYVLKKSKEKDNKTNINNETSKDFVKRILETKIEKYKPTSYTIDWGSLRSQKQGKRSNGMVTGSMGDVTLQRKKEYKSILGGLPEYENIKNEFNGGGLEGEQMKVAYLKAREAGFNQEDSMDFAYTIFEPENNLYKKLKKQTASNSFVSQFKDTLYTALAEGIANRLGELIASNEDKWITIHPHGEESDDYRRLLIKDGETVEDAMHRQGYYNKRQAKDEKALKEEQKQLYHDILKAKKEGNKELHHKLLQRYNEIDAILKGDKKQGTDTKKEEPKKDNITNVKQSKHFEKFNKLLDQEKELRKEWEEKRKIYDEELEKNKKYQELEKKETEIRKQLMTTDYYKDREKYASLQAEKNKISEEKRKIRDEIEQKTGLFEAQRKWSDASIARSDESKNMIKNSSNDIKQQIAKVSSRNDKLVKAFNTLQKDPYILHKNEERKLKKEYDDLLEKYSKMQWGTDEYKATYQKAKEKNAEYVRAYYKSKKMLADFAPKISKLLQVENGVKFETIAENKAMEENAKRLKEVLNGLIPQDVIDNKPLKIYHTGAIRASQSGQSINLHNDERMGTIIHETAHQLEENNPQMLINSLAFAKSRTEGEKQKALSKLASGYRRDEYCKPDKFFDPYCGKLYTLYGGRDRSFVDGHASEIMSMGLQNVFEDPINFAKEDREYFDFVISNLRGDLWD